MLHAALIIGGLAYAGYKAYKESKSPSNIKNRQEMSDNNIKSVSDLSETQLLNNEDEPFSNSTISKNDEEANHYIKASAIALGTSTLAAVAASPGFNLITISMLMYTSIPVLKNAFKGIINQKKVRSTMVESLAFIGTFGNGFYILSSLTSIAYYCGDKLLIKTEDRAKREMIDIFGQHPQSVWLQKGDNEIEIPFEELKKDDIIIIQAGDMIPIDGLIINGKASIDQHVLTGESQPVEKEKGEYVLAATMLISGRIAVQVVNEPLETSAAKIGKILENTSDFKSSIEAKATIFGDMMAVPTLALGGVTLALLGPVSATAAISCNFIETTRLNAPLGILNYLGLASKHGILVKDGRSLELLQDVNTVVFDKTGTLTIEDQYIKQVHVLDSISKDKILQYAAAAEQKQSHPIAKAIVNHAKTYQLEIPSFEDIHYKVGYGIKIKIDNQEIHVGSERFMNNESITSNNTLILDKIRYDAQQNGYNLVYVAVDRQIAGAIEMHVMVRPEAQKVVNYLKSNGLETYIISGDNEFSTQKMAEELGIENFVAKVLPQEKAEIIQELQKEGKSICFIGDGINDAVALKTAHVSVSIKGASTAATDSAGIVLMDGTLNNLPVLLELSKEMKKTMHNGFAAALIPGVIGLAGIFLLHFKLYASTTLFFVSFGAGTLNAMLPIIKHNKDGFKSKNFDIAENQDVLKIEYVGSTKPLKTNKD